MSALGQKQTYAVQNGMSALPPKADILAFLLEKKKPPASLAGDNWHFKMPRGREYAPEKLSKNPAGSSRALLRSRCLRDRSIGWDGEIAAYANDWHRRIFDAIVRQYLLIEAAGIALPILGGRNDKIRDNRRHRRPEILKRFAGMVESLAHR